MSARIFHYVSNANASVTTAACGVGINTKRQNNFSERIDGVSCKKCLAKLEQDKPSEPKKAKKVKEPKAKRDKQAIRRLKKVQRHVEKLYERVAKVGSGTHGTPSEETVFRTKCVDDLLEIVASMLRREKAGWLAL